MVNRLRIRHSLNTVVACALGMAPTMVLAGCAAPNSDSDDVGSASSPMNGTPIPEDNSGFVWITCNTGAGFDFGTGTLLTNSEVITAKHLEMHIGDYVQMGSQTAYVDAIWNYPGVGVLSDLSIAHLDSPLTMNGSQSGYVRQILPQTQSVHVGDVLTCSGYGDGGSAGPPGVLRTATVPVSSVTHGSGFLVNSTAPMDGDSGSTCFDNSGMLTGIFFGAAFGGTWYNRPSNIVDWANGFAASRVLWTGPNGRISLWKMGTNSSEMSYVESPSPASGLTVVNYANNRVLWGTAGKALLQEIDDAGNVLNTATYAQGSVYADSALCGPFAGWTAVNYADGKILWRDTTGAAHLWTVNKEMTVTRCRDYGPFPGPNGAGLWTVVNYAKNHMLWKFDDSNGGRISFWNTDQNGDRVVSNNQPVYIEAGPFPGWTAVNYADDKILWSSPSSGRVSLWTIDSDGNEPRSVEFAQFPKYWVEYGPSPGWSVVNYADNKLLWKYGDGTISYWALDATHPGAYNYIQYGPFSGWTSVGVASYIR